MEVCGGITLAPALLILIVSNSRNLKYILMAGNKVRRLDESINCLTKMLNNYQYDRIIRLEQGFIPKKLAELRQRHKRSLSCNFIISQSSNDCNEWMVISDESGEPKVYTVKFIPGFESCPCLLRCSDCGLCIKSVSCECFDYCVRQNFCKHIHFVAKNRQKNVSVSDEQVFDPEKSNELCIEIDESVDNQSNEMEVLLPRTNCSQDQNVNERKKNLMQKFLAALDKCSSNSELDALENFVKPMEPTVNAIKLKSASQISNLRGSQGTSRNIEAQRRFENQ